MAEQVARLKILAQIEGLEGFDKLKGAFKGLQQAIGPSDQQLSKARKEILAFGKAGEQTEQSLRGQIEALKALQGQASISGTVYKKLGKDIKDLGGAYKEASTGVKQFTDAQLKAQIVGSKPGTFDKQIAALRRGLQDLSVYSRQYTDALTEIQRRQLPFNTALGRQNVIAGFETFREGGKGGAALPELPNTTAGLQQRLSELNEEFVNLSRGGTDWIRVSREIANVQRQLNQEFANPAVEAARRRLEASRNTSSGFLAFSQSASTIGDRIAIEKSIARNQRKQGQAAIELPMMETSELYRSIQAVGLSRIAQQNELMGNSYKQVAQDIRGATAASDGSINSLRSQRSAWESLRNAVNSSSAEFKEASRELAKIDRQLEKTQGGGNKLGQRLQAAGAIASGGIFGGVEGAVGGTIGAVVGSAIPGIGTVGGAFAGAAIGAQISLVRQQVTASAEYAATIGRLNIALKELTSTQQDYAEAQRVIRSVTTELNVPTLEATQGFTKLLASVQGAGGNVRDAEVVFRGVTEAIKATGGTSEDVAGALTAMSQVFSKGKVSAEELSGQLGERLPGAFTRFAAATGRTGAQLSEALKEGTVGLNDVMKFSMALSEQNAGTALKMAKSQEDSTARMKVALTDLQAAFGSAVMPITSSIATIIAKVAELATRTLKSLGLVKDALNEMNAAGRDADLAQRLKDANQPLGLQGIGPLKRQGFSAAEITEFRKRALALEKAITPQSNKAGLEQNLRYLQEVQEVLRKVPADSLSAKQIDAFEADQKRIQGRIDETRASLERLKDTQDKTGKGLTNFANPKDDDGKSAKKAADDAEREAALQQQLNESTARAEIALQDAVHRNAMELIRRRHEYQRELQNIELDNWVKGFTGAGKSAAGMIAGFLKQIGDLRTRSLDASIGVQNAQQQLRSAQSMATVTAGGASTGIVARTGNTGQSTGAHLDLRWGDGRPITRADADKYFLVNGKAPSSFGVTSEYGPRSLFGRNFHKGIDFGTPAGSQISLKGGATFGRDLGNTGAGGYAIEVMTPEGTMRALHLMANSAMKGNGATGAAAQERRAVRAAGTAGAEGVDLQTAEQIAQMTTQQIEKLKSAIGTGFVSDFTEQIREQIKAQEDQNFMLEYRNKLEAAGMRPELIEYQLKKAEAARQLTAQVNAAGEALKILEEKGEGNSDQANRLREAIEALVKLYPQLSKAMEDNARAQAAAADKAKDFGERFKQTLQDAYKSATDLGGQLGNVVVGAIDGISNALVEMASGGKAAFKELAASILKELGAIFIKYALFKALFAAFPGLKIGMAATGGATGPNSSAPLKKFATGGVMSNNVVPMKRYAAGGIAREPQVALYGERGPEAFVPLPDGRTIPVKVQQRSDALNRYRPISAMGTVAGDNESGGAMSAGGAATGGAIDVRYTVERINNVEYVTAEQFQMGMREAAARGAAQGEQRTLRRLQTSVSTRKRIGV